MSDADGTVCELCGEPMPEGEEMFNYHGYSGPCPAPPLAERQQDGRAESEDAETGYDKNDPKHPGWLDRQTARADRSRDE